jgi:hypothetical protein
MINDANIIKIPQSKNSGGLVIENRLNPRV